MPNQKLIGVRPQSFRSFRVYAHRGSRILAPENTAAAFDLALGFGADVLETDVRLARDGVVMVFHDATLERTTDGRGRVREQRATRLEGLDASARFVAADGRRWRRRAARVETLATMFERYPEVEINIDIKDDDPAAADAVAATIAAHARETTVNVGSFHRRVLDRFREAAPGVSTAAGRSEVARLYFGRWPGARPRGAATISDSSPAAPPLPYRWLQIPPSWFGLPLAGERFIATAARRGVRCAYWTIDDPRVMRRLVARGAAGIVTDRPDIACALRDELALQAA